MLCVLKMHCMSLCQQKQQKILPYHLDENMTQQNKGIPYFVQKLLMCKLVC